LDAYAAGRNEFEDGCCVAADCGVEGLVVEVFEIVRRDFGECFGEERAVVGFTGFSYEDVFCACVGCEKALSGILGIEWRD
jgi:hypothetical protein